MMKKGLLISLVLFVLTACQPAQPQADLVWPDQVGPGRAISQADKEPVSQDPADKPAYLAPLGRPGQACIQAAGDYRNYYEIYVASFYDSDGDGIGDLNGIRQKLDYIVDMGFTGIWLMPIHPSNTYHKYDVKDYYAIDPTYGTMADMEALIADCQARNVALIIDLVVNHTGDDHAWFQEAVRYLKSLSPDREARLEDCPYLGYYYFTRDSAKGSSYHQIAGSDWYYEGVFWDQMPDLNLDNPDLRQELKAVMEFWLDKGISGFRLDAVKEYYSSRRSKNIEFLTWLVQAARDKKPDVYLVGENWDTFAEIGQYYKSGLPSLFNFALATAEGKVAQVVNGKPNHTAKSFVEAMVKINQTFSQNNPYYMDGLFIANHDNVRMANYFNGDQNKIKMAAGMYLTMTGVSFTYYGEEIGMVSSGTKDENKRTAMVWGLEAEGQTQDPVGTEDFDQTGLSVADQVGEEDSLIRYYQRALHLRQDIPALAAGQVRVLEAYSGQVVAGVEKTWQDQTIQVFYNISNQVQSLDLVEDSWQDQEIIGALTVKSEDYPGWQNKTLTLPPYSIIVLGEK